MPVRWYDGYFRFESIGPGTPSRNTLTEILKTQAEADAEQNDQTAPLPADDSTPGSGCAGGSSPAAAKSSSASSTRTPDAAK